MEREDDIWVKQAASISHLWMATERQEIMECKHGIKFGECASQECEDSYQRTLQREDEYRADLEKVKIELV